MEHLTRINLKTSGESREDLLTFCLKQKEQYIAIGWSCVYAQNPEIQNYKDYYYAVKSMFKKIRHCHNVFWNAEKNDLFWTRDLDGFYWICRALDKAEAKFIPRLDVGAIIPVEAYKYSLEVPGQIKASFNRPRGGTCEYIKNDAIIAFSKKIYNQLSNSTTYIVPEYSNNIFDNLPDFELEELVISYIQLKENYYLLSNSIANKSTTIKIECEFIHRNKDRLKKAIVQVKGGNSKTVNALDYKSYDDLGYVVYLFAPNILNAERLNNCVIITPRELLDFYNEYKYILPDSITKWEKI